MDKVEKFKSIFNGLDRAYGQYKSEGPKANGKIGGKYSLIGDQLTDFQPEYVVDLGKKMKNSHNTYSEQQRGVMNKELCRDNFNVNKFRLITFIKQHFI